MSLFPFLGVRGRSDYLQKWGNKFIGSKLPKSRPIKILCGIFYLNYGIQFRCLSSVNSARAAPLWLMRDSKLTLYGTVWWRPWTDLKMGVKGWFGEFIALLEKSFPSLVCPMLVNHSHICLFYCSFAVVIILTRAES